jgi:hypothetical protein
MLSSETLPAAVAWRESLGALPSNWLGGPAVLRIDFACRLREQASGEALPFQEASSYLGQAYDGYGAMLGESGCRLTVSSKSTLALLLFLPFESPNEAAWDYVSFLQESLPFRFSTKHWKHWRLSKSRTSYVGRKIAPRGISGSAG